MYTLIFILVTKCSICNNNVAFRKYTDVLFEGGNVSDHFCKCLCLSVQRMPGHISPVWRGTLAGTCRPALTRSSPGCTAWRTLGRFSSSSPALTVITADLSVNTSWGKKNNTRTPGWTLILFKVTCSNILQNVPIDSLWAAVNVIFCQI